MSGQIELSSCIGEIKENKKFFVGNRVAKIREHSYLKWDYVPTRNNQVDFDSRGCKLTKLCEFWWNGSEWLGDCKNWLEQPNITNNDDSEKEKKNGYQITSYYHWFAKSGWYIIKYIYFT